MNKSLAIRGLVVALFVATPSLVMAQVAVQSEDGLAEPTTVEPNQAPPPPPPTLPPAPKETGEFAAPTPPGAAPTVVQAMPPGQWVFTQQYGWIWMPHGDGYVLAPPDDRVMPQQYVYAPTYGWSWVAAPWVWGWGVRPHFGARGHGHYGWYRPGFHRAHGGPAYRVFVGGPRLYVAPHFRQRRGGVRVAPRVRVRGGAHRGGGFRRHR